MGARRRRFGGPEAGGVSPGITKLRFSQEKTTATDAKQQENEFLTGSAHTVNLCVSCATALITRRLLLIPSGVEAEIAGVKALNRPRFYVFRSGVPAFRDNGLTVF
jgi:hypothetical protein